MLKTIHLFLILFISLKSYGQTVNLTEIKYQESNYDKVIFLINKDYEINSIKIESNEKSFPISIGGLNIYRHEGKEYLHFIYNDKEFKFNEELYENLKDNNFTIKLNDQIVFKNNSSVIQQKPLVGDNNTLITDNPNIGSLIKADSKIQIKNKIERGDNILKDAKELLTKNNTYEVNEILKFYNLSIDKVKSPFLKNLSVGDGIMEENSPDQHLSNIAKTDVTNFATGMARFLADRAKQELNESFFSQMRKQMDKVEELKLFFPESNLFLTQLDANTMDFNLDQLRTKFNHNIEKLPYNIYNATQNDYIINKYSQFQNLRNYLDTDKNGILVDYALSSALQNPGRVNPKELLYNFAHGPGIERIKTKQLDNKTKNIINSIKLAELLSNSLLSAEKDRYWVTKEEITELLSDDELFKTYIGLVLAKSEFNEYTIKFGEESFKCFIENQFTDSKGEVSKDLTTLKNLIQNIHQSYAQADEIAKELKNINAEKAVNESYKIFNVFKNNLESINSQLSLISFSSGKNYEFNTELIYKYITPAVDISYSIFSKQYNLAIKNFTILLNDKAAKAYHKNIQEFLKDKEVAKIEIVKFYSKKTTLQFFDRRHF